MPEKPSIDVKLFHGSYDHSHEAQLREAARQIEWSKGNPQERVECSKEKGLREAIKTPTHTRAEENLGRVFVDLSDPKTITSRGCTRYTAIIKDGARFTCDVHIMFAQFLADSEEVGFPGQILRPDCGGECRDEDIGALCRDRCIKQDFKTTDSPRYNSVAGRALGSTESVAMVAALQAPS